MRYRLRRRGIMPLAFAVLLTVAAGLALAEEHAWEHAWAPAAAPDGAVPSAELSGRAAHPDGRETDRTPGSVGRHDRKQAESKPGVGSRALTGHDGAEPAADERPN